MASEGHSRRIKVQVGSGKAGAAALIVVPLLFLAFGIVLFSSVIDDAGDARPAIIMFAILWCTTLAMPGPTGETNELRLTARGPWVCISPWNFPAQHHGVDHALT